MIGSVQSKLQKPEISQMSSSIGVGDGQLWVESSLMRAEQLQPLHTRFICYFIPPQPDPHVLKCALSITFRSLDTKGWKSIWSSTSRCRSMPGAISKTSMPWGVRRKLARSVR